jgi:hypothetical protein
LVSAPIQFNPTGHQGADQIHDHLASALLPRREIFFDGDRSSACQRYGLRSARNASTAAEFLNPPASTHVLKFSCKKESGSSLALA